MNLSSGRVVFMLASALLSAHIMGGSAAAQPGKASDKDASPSGSPSGDAIYLEEKEVVVAPTIVRRETIKEQYKDTGNVRVEREVAMYSDDHLEAEGAYREYHPNGKLFIEGQFRRGRQHGDWTYWFDNGQINRKATYVDGKPSGEWDVFRADGTLAAKRSFKDGIRDGAWITYDATGKQPLSEQHYAAGKEDGTWKSWHPNGKLKQEIGFNEGVPDGKRTEWDEQGNKRSEVTLVDGKVHGTATGWFPDGRKVVREYQEGRLVSESKE